MSKKVIDLKEKAHEILKKHVDTAESVVSDIQTGLESEQMAQLLKRKELLLDRVGVLGRKVSTSESDIITLLNLSNQLQDIQRNIDNFDDFHVGFEPGDDTIEFETTPETLQEMEEKQTALEKSLGLPENYE